MVSRLSSVPLCTADSFWYNRLCLEANLHRSTHCATQTERSLLDRLGLIPVLDTSKIARPLALYQSLLLDILCTPSVSVIPSCRICCSFSGLGWNITRFDHQPALSRIGTPSRGLVRGRALARTSRKIHCTGNPFGLVILHYARTRTTGRFCDVE